MPKKSFAWNVVDVASVHEQVTVDGVAEWREEPGIGHAGPAVLPENSLRVDALLRDGDVRGATEEGQPKVLNVQLGAERLCEGPVEVLAAEERRDGVSEVEGGAQDFVQEVEEAPGLLGDLGHVPADAPQPADEGAHAHAAHPVYRNSGLLNRLQHSCGKIAMQRKLILHAHLT